MKTLRKRFLQNFEREVFALTTLGGKQNTIKLLDVVMSADDEPTMIFEFIDNHGLKWYDQCLIQTDQEVRFYFYKALQALIYASEVGLINGNVKKEHMVVDMDTRTLKLIDWSVGQINHVGKNDPELCYKATAYEAPELRLGYKDFDFKIDLWAVASAFASTVTKTHHIFVKDKSAKDRDDFRDVMRLLGTDDLIAFGEKYGLLENPRSSLIYEKYYPKTSLWDFLNEENADLMQEDVIDLLEKLLVYDPNERLSAAEALLHPYFDSVREQFE